MCACAQALELTTQAGSGWARERQRFLQGSTSGPAAVAAAGGGGEDLDAVAVAAAELLLPLQHWRRVPRMEALAAAGLREAVSYTAVLQLSEPEWEELEAEMRL
ncbi:hypothetical protein CHLRE_07g350626v5 [Chlamydomonas reinhardtii]|uniref:Uncharacterized protein n=1 Tax=Chlamydomonas reinhardtii TaxID=3055 RepID=A0A2K3DLB2_CHLRE|nr:uncharacterized protein CHLRE_07g350626v5 [Chlamydomonas reinhardtii]PNW81308.1 hypothetical protein CHLRE_07g350626v5 [Chlamydomonas reinhardtii]